MTEQCECDVTVDEARRGRGNINRYCPRYFEHLSDSQAKTLREQAERIRELIRERDVETTKAEGACDMAEQYAREAGHDITRHEVLRYVEQYWQSRGDHERRVTALETFHWDVCGLERDLADGLQSGAGAALAGDELARRVIARIKAVNPYTGRQSAAELFPRPQVPRTGTVPLPFDEAA